MRSPTILLKDAWNIFTSNYRLFVGIYLVPGVLALIFGLVFGVKSTRINASSASELAAYPLFFLSLMVIIVVNILMAIAMTKAVSDPQSTTVSSAYNFAKGYFFSYILLGILVGLSVMVGLIALVIPGIIFAIWFSFSYFALLFEDKHGTEAMKASKAYVKGKWWQVFGRYAFLILIAIIVSMVTGIVSSILESGLETVGTNIASFIFNAIIIPVAITYSYLLYQDAKASYTPDTNIGEKQLQQ